MVAEGDHQSPIFPSVQVRYFGNMVGADRAARIAILTTVDALAAAPVLSRVIFCCFSNDSAALHARAMAEFGSPCAD